MANLGRLTLGLAMLAVTTTESGCDDSGLKQVETSQEIATICAAAKAGTPLGILVFCENDLENGVQPADLRPDCQPFLVQCFNTSDPNDPHENLKQFFLCNQQNETTTALDVAFETGTSAQISCFMPASQLSSAFKKGWDWPGIGASPKPN